MFTQCSVPKGLVVIMVASVLFGLVTSARGSESGKEPLTVRVDWSKGAPRLMVNGQPRRARVLFCLSSGNSIVLTPEARPVSFEFVPTQSAGNGTMQFRLPASPANIWLDDIRVVDLNTGKDILPLCDFEGGVADFTREWFARDGSVLPAGAENTVGTATVEPGAGRDGSQGLHISLKAPADGKWPDFHVSHNPNLVLNKEHRYRVSFWAKADAVRDLTVGFFIPGAPSTYVGGPPGHQESQIKLAANAGVDFVSYDVNLPWPAPGEPENWDKIDETVEYILRANPHALLIPRIESFTPQWWKKVHPDELMRFEDGVDHAAGYPYGPLESVASVRYREDASERLRLMIEHLENKYGDHMAGYHPSGQSAGEWQYWECWTGLLNGYAPCDLIAFRAWLKQNYSNVESLRLAWGDPAVTFDTAAVPSASARRTAPDGAFRDPVAERPIIDFVQFQQESMADMVCQLARVVRQATGGRKLVLFFYGYVSNWVSITTGPGTSGHYGLRRVLSSPDIDLVCGPVSYDDRAPGGNGLCLSVGESVTLAGKMWLNEDDTRTYLVKNPDFNGGTNLNETLGVLTRNVSQEAFRNFATWWMDLGGAGWFDDPNMWALMKKLQKLDEPFLKNPIPYQPEMALVIDEPSLLRLAAGQRVGERSTHTRTMASRAGAPYGDYLLDDVVNGRVHSKLYVFTSAWVLSAETRAKLLAATQGSTKIWSYAPGYFDGYRKSPEAMRELTGFTLTPVFPGNAWATPTELGKKMGLQKPFGLESAVWPLFEAADAKPDEILATYPDGSTAAAIRQLPSGTSIFIGVPGFSTDMIRLAAKSAGVHLFTDVNCNVYGNGPYLSLHASQDGPVTLDTGRPDAVQDVLTGEMLGRGPKLVLPMKLGQTRVLRIQDRLR